MRNALPLLFFACLLPASSVGAGTENCEGIDLIVLGSGGPELDDGRASSGYALLREGRARVLVDLGPGTAAAFDRAQLRFEDLEAVLLTHLHVDHAADLPAFVKGGWFTERTADLPVFGPTGNDRMPATDAYVSALFEAEGGPYRYLADHLPGGTADARLVPRNIATAGDRMITAYERDGFVLQATPVHHGPIPALGWRVEFDGCAIAFSGDTSGRGEALERLATDAAVFVAHAAIPEDAGRSARNLHMPPSRIGEAAAAAGVGRLVLSHFMNRSLADLDGLLTTVREQFPGTVVAAEDGLRIHIGAAEPAD